MLTYCTTPSGTRYQIGRLRPILSRQSVLEIASAGISTRLTRPIGRPGSTRRAPVGSHRRSAPGRTTSSASCQVRIWASASAPVMKYRSQSGPRSARRSRSVSTVYVGPPRSMSIRLTEKRGLRRRRDDRHEVAVLGGRDLSLGLLPRLAGRHEDDLVERRTGRRPRTRRRGGRGGRGRTCRP